MTYDADRFCQAKLGGSSRSGSSRSSESLRLFRKGFLVLHEGKTFHQFDDHWEAAPNIWFRSTC